jgi:hypothetical protein
MTLKKVFGTLGMAIVAVFMTLLVSNPAMAYDDYFSTNDGDPGGRLWWTANGDVVKVCDIEADGWGVRAYIQHIHSGEYLLAYEVNVGGNGNCTTHQASQGGRYDLPEGDKVDLYLCLTRTIDGEKYCDERTWANG